MSGLLIATIGDERDERHGFCNPFNLGFGVRVRGFVLPPPRRFYFSPLNCPVASRAFLTARLRAAPVHRFSFLFVVPRMRVRLLFLLCFAALAFAGPLELVVEGARNLDGSAKPRCVVEELSDQGLALLNWETEAGQVALKVRCLALRCSRTTAVPSSRARARRCLLPTGA